jgi:anaerobic C4-dicarboxylate transporter DcuB
MAGASIASQMGIMASPVSVAIVSLAAFLAKAPVDGHTISFVTLLSVSIPSTLVGVLAIGIFSWFRGKDLDKDPEFQARIADPENRKRIYGETTTLMGKKLGAGQWTAMWIFLGGIVVVALLGAFESLRPLVGGKPISMILTIQMFMLTAGALMVMFTGTDPAAIGKSEVFRAGMIAVIAVFGIAWMADTVFDANLPALKASLANVVKEHPWAYALALLVVSKFVNSQAAAISALVPVALAIGVPPGYVVAFGAAAYGYYILPTYPSDLATIQFDRSGTTRIGKYVINHSFILPGLIGVFTSCVFGAILSTIYGLI